MAQPQKQPKAKHVEKPPAAPPPLGTYSIQSKRDVLSKMITFNGHVLTVKQFLEKACGLVEAKEGIQKLKELLG